MPTADFDLQAVWSFAPDDAFAVGSSGAIHWDGKTWSVVSDGTDAGIERITSLWASGPNDLWGVAAGDGHLFHGVRGATGALAWSSYDMNAGASFQFVTGRAPGDLWITAFADDGTQLLEHATLGDAGPPTLTPVTGARRVMAAILPLRTRCAEIGMYLLLDVRLSYNRATAHVSEL